MLHPQPYFTNTTGTLYHGDALEVLRHLPDESVQCVVTSPPYWGLRNYGVAGQIGLESSPEKYTANMVAVFDEVARVLKKDGTLWLNLGDCYTSTFNKRQSWDTAGTKQASNTASREVPGRHVENLKPKNLVGIPWRVAFALQARGWYLRQDIIWHKVNAMPESVIDRPTKVHEYLFLLSKSERYYYNHEAIKEPATYRTQSATALTFARRVSEPLRPGQNRSQHRPERIVKSGNKARKNGAARGCPAGTGSNVCSSVPWEGTMRNKRSVWDVPTKSLKEAHFATFPPKLITPCILAGSGPGDVVLDPFLGSGTTAMVARKYGRKWLGIEINQEYCDMALKRIGVHAPYLWEVEQPGPQVKGSAA